MKKFPLIFRQHEMVRAKPINMEQGQNIVEFALILGLMLVFLFASIEITNLLQQKADLDNVVKQAARQAGEFGGGREEIEAYIRQQMRYMNYQDGRINNALATLKLEAQNFNGTTFIPVPPPNNDECTYGQFIAVTMQVDAQVDIPAFLFFEEFSRGIPLTVSNTARCWRSS